MLRTRYLLYALLLTIIFACDKSLKTEGLPSCVQTLIEEDNGSEYPTRSISEQIVNAETFFLLIDNFASVGGTNYILNNQCDSICFYCSDCVLPDCANDFPREGWIVIWEQ